MIGAILLIGSIVMGVIWIIFDMALEDTKEPEMTHDERMAHERLLRELSRHERQDS